MSKEKIDLGFSVDVASLKMANSLIQSVTSSIGAWVNKVRDLGSTTGIVDKALQKTFTESEKGYDDLGKKTGNYVKNKKKLEDYSKTLKTSNLEYTKYNKKLKESGKTMNEYGKMSSSAVNLNSKNQSQLRGSLRSSQKDIDEFGGFDDMTTGIRNFGNTQEDILSNLNASLESVTAKTGMTSSAIDDTVLSLDSLGTSIATSAKNSDYMGRAFDSGFSLASNSAGFLKDKISMLPGGLISAAGSVGSALKGISGKMGQLQGTLTQGFSKVSSTIKDSAFSIGSLFPPLAALGGAAGGIMTIKGAFESAWNSGQELEKMTVKMTNRFGSSEYAKKATGFIQDMSQEYGLAKDDLASYTDQLGEMGLSVDKVNFKGVLNAANGPGKDLQSTMSAMTALAKGGDFQSFTEAFGNTIDPTALQESLAGATTYQERMQKTADFLDGQFAGNTDRMKNSTEGQIASISGFFEKIQQTISGSGAFKAMQDVLTNIFNTIESNKEGILEVAKTIGSMMGTIIKFIGGLMGNITGSMGGATGFFKGLIGKMKDIFYPIIFILGYIGMKVGSMISKLFRGDLAGGVTDFGDIIAKLINGITGIVGKVFDIVTGFFKWFNNQLPTLIPAVVKAFGKIIDSIVGFAKMVGNKVSALFPELLKTLGGLVKMIVPMLKKLLLGVIEILIDWTPKLLSMLWQALVWVAEQLAYIGPELGKMLAEGLGMLGKWISDWIGGLADKLLKSDNPFLRWLGKMLEGVKTGWDAIISVLQGAVTAAGNIIGKIGDFFSSIFSGNFMDAGGKLFDIFDNIGSFISDTFKNAFDSVLGFISNFLGDMASNLMNSDNPFMNFIGGIIQYFSDGIKMLKGIFSGAFDFIGGVISDIGSFIGNIFGNVFDLFKNLFTGDFSGAWENIKGIFSALWTFIKSILGRILTLIMQTFTSIFTFIWDTLKNVFNTFVTMFGNILGYLGTWIKGAWDTFTKFLGDLPDKFSAAFTFVKDAVIGVLSSLPDTIINFVGSIPAKIGQLLSGGFKGLGNLGESIFGEGFFDPLIRMFKGFMNFVIKGLNNILPGGMKIPLMYDDSTLKDQAKSLAGQVGDILSNPAADRNLQPVIKRIHDATETLIGDQGAKTGSAMSQVMQKFDAELNSLNKKLGDTNDEKTKKEILDQIIPITAAMQNLAKSTISKETPMDEKTAAKPIKDLIGWIAGDAKEAFSDSLSKMKGIIDVKMAPPVKDGFTKDGVVTPVDPNDKAYITKQPGVVESLGRGDFMGAAKSAGAKVVDVAQDTWSSAKSVGSKVKDGAMSLGEKFMGTAASIGEKIKGAVHWTTEGVKNTVASVADVAKIFTGQKEKYKIGKDGKIIGNLGFQDKAMTDFMSQSGYKGASESGDKEGAAWCAAFVKSAYASVFKNTPEIWDKVKDQFGFGALLTLDSLTKGGMFEKSMSNPVPGSLMAWKSNKVGESGKGHIGLVTEVMGKLVKTIEGNTGSDGTNREGVMVAEITNPKPGSNTYDRGTMSFAGFANPKFDSLLASLIPKNNDTSNISTGTSENPAKDFVIRPGQKPMFFEPTDTVFGVRKTVGLENQPSTNSMPSSQDNSISVTFGTGSIVINSTNPTYDAQKLLSEIETLIRRKQGRMYGVEAQPNY